MTGLVRDDEIAGRFYTASHDARHACGHRLVDDEAPALAYARHEQAVSGSKKLRKLTLVDEAAPDQPNTEPHRFRACRCGEGAVARHDEHCRRSETGDCLNCRERLFAVNKLAGKRHDEISRPHTHGGTLFLTVA